LLEIKNKQTARVWVEAEKLYKEKLGEAVQEQALHSNGKAQ